MAAAYMFVPMIMAIIVQRLIYKEPVKEPLGISFKLNRWFVVAWLLPPVVALASIGISSLFPGVEYSPGSEHLIERLGSVLTREQLQQVQSRYAAFPVHPIWVGLLLGLIAGVTVNAVAGFGEELGWRGLLQKELDHMGFWKSSAVIGIVWGVWHAPIIIQGHNYPQRPVAGVFMMVAFTLLLAPIFSYVRLRANSVIAAAIIHGSLNGTAGVSLMALRGGTDLTVGVTGLAGFIVLAMVNLVILAYDRYLASEPIMRR